MYYIKKKRYFVVTKAAELTLQVSFGGFFTYTRKGLRTMLEFISKSTPLNLIITGIFVLCAILIIVKTIKELSVKVGDKSVSFSSKKTQSEIVKVVTDYADFKYKIKEEQAEGVNDLHLQAKRVVQVQIDQYVKRITVDYMVALNKSGAENAGLTINIFSLLMRILYNEMYKFCMEIFERNHLKDKSDSELKELAETNYQRLADIFREFMQTNWLDVMGEYEVLHNICMAEINFVRNLMYCILASFRDLSCQKYELINTINDIDCKVRENVQNNGVLPTNAISILSDLYIPGTGLNRNSVERWLSTTK